MTRILAFFLALMATALPAQAERILVFAAASLAGPLDEAADIYQEMSGDEVVISYAGSSALARQIEQGAPADLFLSANQGWMDHLAALGHIRNDTRRNLWGNKLVLVSSQDGAPVEIGPTLDVPALLNGGRLAVALTDAVPAGIYAREALSSLGLWDAAKDALAAADNVRAALALVSTGAAPWGIVYATDAVAEPRVHVRGTFPEESHQPILYPGALIAFARPQAQDFLDFLSTPETRELFETAGFNAAIAP